MKKVAVKNMIKKLEEKLNWCKDITIKTQGMDTYPEIIIYDKWWFTGTAVIESVQEVYRHYCKKYAKDLCFGIRIVEELQEDADGRLKHDENGHLVWKKIAAVTISCKPDEK